MNLQPTFVGVVLALGIGALAIASSAHAQQQPAAPVPAPPNATTLQNLQAAFDGESNAHARYVEFARKADAEGYSQVASLFRAAARAEQIHAANHAQVIKSMGGTPEAKIEPVQPKSTRENLEAAIKGESYERDTMYPQFLERARADGNRDAVRTLNLARTAEIEHAKLYKAALDNLEQWKTGVKQFYVCTVCGDTLTALPDARCPSCFSPKEKFVVVE